MIPTGWKLIKIGEVGKVVTGSTPPTSKSEYYGGDVPFVAPGDLGFGKFVGAAGRTLTAAGLRVSRPIPAGATLFTCIGSTIGKLGLAAVRVTTNQQINAVVPDENHDPGFIYYQLAAEAPQIALMAGMQAVPMLSKSQFASQKILAPPLPEQRRIADILSIWDKAIETVEALIANTTTWRNGLLYEQLGHGDWPLRTLASLGEFSSAGVDKKSYETERPVRLLNYVDVLRRDFIDDRSLSHWVTAPDRQIAKCDVRLGDVFFTPSSETRDDIAHSAVATQDIPGAAYSYHVVRFRLAEPWPLSFRAYAFKSKTFLKQAQALCAGSGQRYVLSQRQFGSISIRVPPLAEQEKIGNLLHAVDQERDLLTAQRDALRREKAALMQQLLTGKRRVKLDVAEAA